MQLDSNQAVSGKTGAIHSLHALEVECINKGKSRQPYEVGVKVSVTTTHKEGVVVGMRSLPAILTTGIPYTWLWSRWQS